MLNYQELEETLSRLDSVDAVRVVTEGERVAEVHILAATSKPPKQVVRDVQSLAMARYGTNIDRRVISVVQLAAQAMSAASSARAAGDADKAAAAAMDAGSAARDAAEAARALAEVAKSATLSSGAGAGARVLTRRPATPAASGTRIAPSRC